MAQPEKPTGANKRALSPSSEPDKSTRKRSKINMHRRKSEENAVILVPGNVLKGKSFTRFWTKEGELAGYLTYAERHQMRRFAMSAYVLWAYVYSFKDRGSKQVRQQYVLEYIRDMPTEMENNEDPQTVYAVQEDGVHAVPRMALALCQMRRKIEKAIAEKAISGEAVYCQKDQEEAQEQFRTLTGRTPPKFAINNVELKPLGPFTEYGECELEAYNRCLNAIMYASFSANSSTWDGRFGLESWEDPVQITLEHVPNWMRGSDVKDSKDSPPDAPLQEGPGEDHLLKALRQIPVFWEWDCKALYAREFWAFLEEQGLSTGLSFRKTVKVLPTDMRSEVCDGIRAVFDLDTLEGQIKALQPQPQMINVYDAD